MSSEVCPFCGKSFKRLKSHLPHCKAAKSSKAASQHEETKMSSSSSSLPPPGPDKSQHSVKTETSAWKMDTEVDKTPIKPTSVKKTKLKLSDKIKMAVEMSSPNLIAPTPSPSASKTKKKIATSSEINKKVIEKKESDSEILDFNQTEKQLPKPTTKKRNVDKAQPAKQTELNDILTKKTSPKRAKVTVVSVNGVKTKPKDHVLFDEEDNKNSLPEKDLWTSRQDAKITLHDVRATLGRAKPNGRQKHSSIEDKLPTEELKCEIVKQNKVPSQLLALSPGKSELMLLKSGNLMSDLLTVESKDCNFTQRADILKDGLRMDRHTMGCTALSSPARTFLEAEASNKALGKHVVQFLKPEVQKTQREMEETRDLSRQDGGHCSTRDALLQQRLGQVQLRELPDWLVTRSPRRPRDALQMFNRGWQWYYGKYIDVKKGGIGGVAMLLAGYCVMSYIWAYPHLKLERWRKYH